MSSQTALTLDMLDWAVRFHGHLGPFLVLGLKAGLIGLKHLGKDYSGLDATVETEAAPPRSCFIDGVQFTSGCTLGKGSIKVRIGNNVSVLFVGGERRIFLIVKDAILKALEQSDPSQIEMMAEYILQKADDELFTIRVD